MLSKTYNLSRFLAQKHWMNYSTMLLHCHWVGPCSLSTRLWHYNPPASNENIILNICYAKLYSLKQHSASHVNHCCCFMIVLYSWRDGQTDILCQHSVAQWRTSSPLDSWVWKICSGLSECLWVFQRKRHQLLLETSTPHLEELKCLEDCSTTDNENKLVMWLAEIFKDV